MMSMPGELSDLHALFCAEIQSPHFRFEPLARKVLRYQWEHVPTLRRYWQERGVEDIETLALDQLVAVPADVFRYVELVSNEGPPTGAFRTSGTTSGARGQHLHLEVETYRLSARHHFRACVLEPAGLATTTPRFINVVFDPAEVCDSSLSFMVDDFARHFGREPSPRFGLDRSGLDRGLVEDELDRAISAGVPAIVFGTAFALADLMDVSAPRALPAGSLCIQTGGFKGKRDALEPSDFFRELASHFKLPAGRVLSEYGMTELSSQLYSDLRRPAETSLAAAQRPLVAPPWCEVRACDPQTLEVLAHGERGLLRFFDLANLSSVALVQTSDEGRITDDGVILYGRSSEVTPRGCSLAIEELRTLDSDQS